MVLTTVEIWNMALGRIGEARVSSPNDTAEEAQQCALYWNQTRDEVLRAHPWNCATERVQVAALSGANLTKFAYRYQLPADCLRVLNLIDVAGGTYEDLSDEHRVEGRNLYTDVSPCGIRYIKQVNDPMVYDSSLVECLVLKLASKIAYPLTGRRDIEDYMLQQYMLQLTYAQSLDGEESQEAEQPNGFWSEES